MDISNKLASRKRKNSIKHEAKLADGSNFAFAEAVQDDPVDVSIDAEAGVIDIDYGALTKIPKLEKDDDTSKLRIDDTDEYDSDDDEVLNLIGEFLASSTTKKITNKRKRGKKQGKKPNSKQKSTTEATQTAEAPREPKKDVSGDESNSYVVMPKLQCEVCGKLLRTRQGLNTHRSMEHTDRIYQTVANDEELMKLLNMPYVGELCGVKGCSLRYKAEHDRTRHWKIAHFYKDVSKFTHIQPIRVPCGFPTCYRIFSSITNRRKHIRQHHVKKK